MTSKLKFQLQRVSTILRSLKTVYTLPSEQIDAFLDSYNIYDHNWANEDEMKRTMGADYYSVVKRKLVDYYNVLNQLCSVGQIEKMYIPPVMDLSKSVIANQTLFEQKMSRDLGLKSGSNALDIGCGRGRVATEMAAYSGANVQGINIDPGQIAHAKRLAIEYGLTKQCQFKLGDINDLPLSFSGNAFDAVYHIQVFTYSKDLEALFKDIHRILKPGARFACLDFVTLPDYDKNNPRHADLMKRVRPLLGAIGTRSATEYVGLLMNAGFEILTSENASIDGLQAPLAENVDRYFTRVAVLIGLLVKTRVLPKHFKLLFDRLTKDGQSFAEADRLRIMTTSYYIVARKT